jgi:hypothetical protein
MNRNTPTPSTGNDSSTSYWNEVSIDPVRT